MIWIADAHRGDGKRFIVRADEKLTAFMERESAIRLGRVELSLLTNGSEQRNLRRNPVKPSTTKPSRETVEPLSGTPTPVGLTLTSSRSHVVRQK
jgi:hypothetical protein